MAAASLIEKTEFSTADADTARDLLDSAYGDNRLRVVDPMAGDGILSMKARSSTGLSLRNVESPAELMTPIAGASDEVVFSTLHEGTVSIDRRGWKGEGLSTVGPGDVVLSIHPGLEWVHHSRPTRNQSVGVRESLLLEAGGADPQDPSQAWEPLSPRPIPGRELLWRSATTAAEAVFDSPAASDAPLVVGQAERIVAASALFTFPNRLVEALGGEGHAEGRDVLRRAVAFIESNPDENISVTDIALAAHTSVRNLQLTFHRHEAGTPTDYLRRVRLERVRADLLAAAPGDGHTVTSIGAKWGFANPGRMAAFYREEYGELPKQTLRRT